MKDLEKFSKFVHIKGVRTHYYDAGKGDPIVLIHGGGLGNGASVAWAYNIADLARDFRVIAADQLGFGLTDMPKEADYSLTARAEHIIALLEQLKIRSAHICGQSQGSWVAAYIALNRPEMVKKLILVNSGSITLAVGRHLDIHPPDIYPTKESVKQHKIRYIYRPELFTDEMADTAFEYAKRNYEVYKELFKLTAGNPETRRGNTSIGGKHISEIINQIKAPTLIIWGKADDVPLERGIWLLNSIEGSQMHIFSDSHHSPFIDHYEEFNRIVTIFCKAGVLPRLKQGAEEGSARGSA